MKTTKRAHDPIPKLRIDLGALAPPLRIQLASQGYEINVHTVRMWQREADAISLCRIREYATEHATLRAERLLLKRIRNAVIIIASTRRAN